MKLEFLNLMKCSYCGSDIKIGDVYEEREGELINGRVKCECSEFSVLEGILNIKPGPLNKYVINSLARHRVNEAVGLSLWKYAEDVCRIASLPEFGKLGRLLLALSKIVARHTYKKYVDKDLSLFSLLGTSASDMYLKHRFSAESFWPIYPFVPVLKGKGGRILDIGCGAGHASFILSTYVRPKELVCVDYAFRNLYQAKKYFVKDAEFICLDANYPLPFKNSTFDAIFMSDVFHYIYARTLLAREMERLLLPQGIILLLHLYNSLSYDPAAHGKPLSPLNWGRLFQQLPVKTLPERNLIEDFVLNNKLDLVKEYPEAELNACNTICLVGTKDKTLFRVYKEINEGFLMHKDNLIINPIYGIEHRRERAILRRQLPSESFRREYPITEKYLPEEYTIGEGLCKILKGRTLNLAQTTIPEEDLHHIEYLMKKFIVINVPKNYY